MSRGLDLGLIAEGVENRTQLRYLRSRGCTEVQGFIFSGAVPAHEVAAMLRENPYRGIVADAPSRMTAVSS